MLTFEMEMCNYGMEVLTKANNMERVMSFVELCVKDIGSPKASHQLALVGEEVAMNIFSYAYGDTPGTFFLKIKLCPEHRKVSMEFRDRGKPYNPLMHTEPDLDVHISERNIGGLGIMLSKKLTDSQSYKYENGQNVLLVEKYLKSS